jgi:chemotaxis protein methyltransferase WspC
LRGCTACAHGWYLLGLIREASQDSTAVDCYRKALYLDPNHYETLLQMALLAEKDGNAASARTFRNRADRLKPKNLRAS